MFEISAFKVGAILDNDRDKYFFCFMHWKGAQRTQLSFQYARSKILWVLSKEIGVDTALYPR
jgi:hypothetical protein